MKTSKSIIRLENVWKIYTMGEIDISALKGIYVDINQGEFVAIVGASGSGKSTMMNLVGCLDMPSKGTIYLDNRDISSMPESELAQIRGKKIGFIFQQFNLIQTLTAIENVALPMIFQNTTAEQRTKKATELLEMVNLGDRMNHKPSEMSGGQQQRVAIARSLANDPDVILADEPTGNLDSKTGDSVMDFLCNLHVTKGKTIILVTHDEHVAQSAERIEYLKDGVVVSTKKGKGHNKSCLRGVKNDKYKEK